MFDLVVTVWCAGWALVAGVGAWRYARPGSAPAVRVAARVERVEPPRESGAEAAVGIQVVLAFQDPATGEQLTVPTTGARNGTLAAAWVGRQITVTFPAGRPYGFRVVTGDGRMRQLALPVAAACFAWIGLIARLAADDDSIGGVGWVPLGFGVLVTCLATWGAVVTHRDGSRRKLLLATAQDATARVVASLRHTHRDDDGHTHTGYVPVVTFPTADGRTVTAVGPPYTSRPLPPTTGTDIPVRYAPADPSVFAFDTTTDRRAYSCGLVFLTTLALAGLAATAAGAILLGAAG